MLVLTRKLGESITIGDNITITVMNIKGGQVKIGIAAPPESQIMREEVAVRIKELNVMASAHAADDFASIASTWHDRNKKTEAAVED